MDVPNYLDYGGMYSMNPGAGYQALDQASLAQQFEQQKREEAAKQAAATLETSNLANMYSQQTLPSRVEAQRLDTATKAAELEPKITAAEVSKATRPQTISNAQREAVMKASQQEIDNIGQQAQLMAYSSDPEQQKRGLQLMQLHKDFVKMRAESDLRKQEQAQHISAQYGLEGMRERSAKELEQMRIDAGKYKKASATFNNFSDLIASGKLTYEKAATMLLGQSMFTDDPKEAELLRSKAAEFEDMNLRQRTTAVQGRPDIAALTQGQVPTQQVTPVLSSGQRATQPAPQKNSLADVQKMYPGVPADKLKQAYKAKFGVDLQ